MLWDIDEDPNDPDELVPDVPMQPDEDPVDDGGDFDDYPAWDGDLDDADEGYDYPMNGTDHSD